MSPQLQVKNRRQGYYWVAWAVLDALRSITGVDASRNMANFDRNNMRMAARSLHFCLFRRSFSGILHFTASTAIMDSSPSNLGAV